MGNEEATEPKDSNLDQESHWIKPPQISYPWTLLLT